MINSSHHLILLYIFLGLSFIPALGKSIDPFDPCDLLEDKLQEFKKSGDIKVSVFSSSGHRESESVQTKPGVAFFQFRSSKKQKCEAKDCRFSPQVIMNIIV